MLPYYFIVNEKSRRGKAKKIWATVETELKRKEVEYEAFLTEYVGHATELAAMLSEKTSELDMGEFLRIVVVGGDGTMDEVINGISDFSKIHFGYIPTGSGNDLCRGLGIAKQPLVNLQYILKHTQVRAMDLGSVHYGDGEKHYFAISSGIGLDAEVCERVDRSKLKSVLNALGAGKLTYLFKTLEALFTMPVCSAKVILDGEKKIALKRMIFLVAMNHRFEGGGIPMAPNANAYDGVLTLCLAYGFSRGRAFLALPSLLAGSHEKLKGFHIINCRTIDVCLDQDMYLHADGEIFGKYNSIHFECEPHKLYLMM